MNYQFWSVIYIYGDWGFWSKRNRPIKTFFLLWIMVHFQFQNIYERFSRHFLKVFKIRILEKCKDFFATFTRFLWNYETAARAARPPGQQGWQGNEPVRPARVTEIITFIFTTKRNIRLKSSFSDKSVKLEEQQQQHINL